jgi:hypothetical protein
MSSVLEKKTKLSDARISPLAGKAAPREMLVDLARLEKEYFDRKPDLEDANQLVVFGTSGHRGTFPGNHAPIGGVKSGGEVWLVCRAALWHRKRLQDLC